MIDFRCKACGHLLAKEGIREGALEIRCPKCKTYNTIKVVGSQVAVDTFLPSIYTNRRQSIRPQEAN